MMSPGFFPWFSSKRDTRFARGVAARALAWPTPTPLSPHGRQRHDHRPVKAGADSGPLCAAAPVRLCTPSPPPAPTMVLIEPNDAFTGAPAAPRALVETKLDELALTSSSP